MLKLRTNKLLFIVAVFLLSTAAGCGFSGDEPAEATSAPRGAGPNPLIRITEIEQREVSPRVTAIGSVVPVVTSIVASGASGVVDQFLVEEGEFVEAGRVLSVLRMVSTDLGIDEAKEVLNEREQELAELVNGSRKEEIEAAQARMLAADAVRQSAASRLIRIRELFSRKASNQEELDAALERAEAARQLHLAAKANFELVKNGPRKEAISQARARYASQDNHVKFLKSEKAKRTTAAPFAGFVVLEQTHQGQWLSKGDPVVTLVSLAEVNVVVNIDQDDLQHVQIGNQAEVFVKGAAKERWSGTIKYLVSRSEWQSGSRGFPVKIRINNQIITPEKKTIHPLKEGMMAEVSFTGFSVLATLVPKDSIIRTPENNLLFVCQKSEEADQTGTVRQVVVKTGISEGEWIQVFSDDLKPGMFVVSEGAERLRPMQTVTILTDDDQPSDETPPKPTAKN